MGTHELFTYSRTEAKDPKKQPEHRITPLVLDSIPNFLPIRKDGQQPSFEDVLVKAYDDFPKLKMHVSLHPSEYENTINLINGLPTQLQNKWRLLRFCLWYQYGPSIFAVIFNLTPDKTSKEIALLSDLPNELTDMVSELLEDGGDIDEDEIEENITHESFSKGNRVNPEKRDFVILAEGGQKWKTLTNNQRLALEERYLSDQPDTVRLLARRLGKHFQSVGQIETAGLSKLGFFGDAINLTRQQLQNVFENAKEENLNNLSPEERKLLERLYGDNARVEHSYPTIRSVAADIKVTESIANKRHQKAMQKLLHTKRAIRIDMSLSPTSEQVVFMRQKSPVQGTRKVAKEMERSLPTVRRWQKKEGIRSRRGTPPISPSPEELEFIKNKYPNMGLIELTKLTGHANGTITRWLRDAGVIIRKRGEAAKIIS